MNKFKLLLNNKKARRIGLLSVFIYLIIYLISTNNITLGGVDSFSFIIADNWFELLFKTRAAFLWEAIGIITIPFIQLTIFLSILNILLGLAIGILVGLNITATIYLYTLPKVCRPDLKVGGLFAILPGFLTGFACCAPSFILPLVSVFSGAAVFFNNIRPFLIPVTLIALIWALRYSLKRVPEEIKV
jgi:hypothetical protein